MQIVWMERFAQFRMCSRSWKGITSVGLDIGYEENRVIRNSNLLSRLEYWEGLIEGLLWWVKSWGLWLPLAKENLN